MTTQKIDRQSHTLTVYIAQENTDRTEGKGQMKDIGWYLTDEAAYAAAKGRGVMGVGDGEIVRMDITIDPEHETRFKVKRTRIYGYGQINGVWQHGWLDGRSRPTLDPEWEEYARLYHKFEGLAVPGSHKTIVE